MSINEGRSRQSKETLPPTMSQVTTAKTPGPAKLSLLNFSSQESVAEPEIKKKEVNLQEIAKEKCLQIWSEALGQ